MNQMQLPPHWRVVKLGDLLESKVISAIQDGNHGEKHPKHKDFQEDGIPFLTADCIREGRIIFEKTKYLDESWLQKLRIGFAKPGDVLLTHKGTLGEVSVVGNQYETIILSPQVTYYRINDLKQLDKNYLFIIFQSPIFKSQLEAFASSQSTRAYVGITQQRRIWIPLPSSQEQQAIAHTLRTIQKAKEARQRELELERERKAALMQYLFTHGTRNEPRKKTELGDIPESWQVVKLGKVCKFLQYGTSKKCDLDSSGLPVLRIPNVIGGKIDTGDLKFVKLSSNEVESLILNLGDLLFVRTNGRREYTGRCAVFSGELQEALFASYLIRARLDTEHLLPEFAQFYTMTYQGKKYLSERASSASDGKFNINTQTIKSVLIPKPDIDEQGEIINALQASDRKITALEQEAVFLDELFRAMLEELMTGRLSALSLVEEKAIA